MTTDLEEVDFDHSETTDMDDEYGPVWSEPDVPEDARIPTSMRRLCRSVLPDDYGKTVELDAGDELYIHHHGFADLIEIGRTLDPEVLARNDDPKLEQRHRFVAERAGEYDVFVKRVGELTLCLWVVENG